MKTVDLTEGRLVSRFKQALSCCHCQIAPYPGLLTPYVWHG